MSTSHQYYIKNEKFQTVVDLGGYAKIGSWKFNGFGVGTNQFWTAEASAAGMTLQSVQVPGLYLTPDSSDPDTLGVSGAVYNWGFAMIKVTPGDQVSYRFFNPSNMKYLTGSEKGKKIKLSDNNVYGEQLWTLGTVP